MAQSTPSFSNLIKDEWAELLKQQMMDMSRQVFGSPSPEELARQERISKLCREQGHNWGPTEYSSNHGVCWSCEGTGLDWGDYDGGRAPYQDCSSCQGTGRESTQYYQRCKRKCGLPDAFRSS